MTIRGRILMVLRDFERVDRDSVEPLFHSERWGETLLSCGIHIEHGSTGVPPTHQRPHFSSPFVCAFQKLGYGNGRIFPQ